jgi:two-component system nitrate/nitrite response regulator NarL
MKPCFMTPSGQPLKRWSAAFPDLVVRSDIKSCVQSGPTDGRLYWLDIVAYPEADAFDAIRSLSEAGGRVIALTAQPNDAEAFALLSAGARGYCHAEAVPEQLREVASVVESGGYWMPSGLVQRLLSAAVQRESTQDKAAFANFDQLTQREYAVAVNVGKGLNNREIAEALDITERTVKAHLTAIFEKLQLRDRVQLALAVNRLPTP